MLLRVFSLAIRQTARIGQRAAVQNDIDSMTAAGRDLAKPAGACRNDCLHPQHARGVAGQKVGQRAPS